MKANKAFGSLMRTQVKKALLGFIQKPSFGFWAPRVVTLGAVLPAGHLRKEGPRVTERKEKDHDQVSNLGLAEKAMLRHKKMTRTRLFGEKEKARARKERKENMAKVRILSKECLHGMEKEKEMASSKEASSKVFHSNSHKQMLHSSHPPRARCLLRTNRKLPMPKRAGVGTKHIGQMTGHGTHITTMVVMKENTPKVIGTIGLILLPVRN